MSQIENHLKELYLYRIISGQLKCQIGRSGIAWLYPAPVDIKYQAQEIYIEALSEAMSEGIMNDEQLVMTLMAQNMWSVEEQEKLDNLPKQIEDLKVDLYNATFRSSDRAKIRKTIDKRKVELLALSNKRHAFDHSTCTGVALLAKNQFLLLSCLHDENKQRIFPCLSAVDGANEEVFHDINEAINNSRLSESKFRELARTEPWRSMWSAGKHSKIFPNDSYTWTDDQQNLYLWSRMYDNIHEHPDCPHDSILEDDDMLDGWMIIQRRKREENLQKKEGEEYLKGSATSRHNEIYVPVQTAEDAAKIEALNSMSAKMQKQQRLNYLKQKGQVAEEYMPDSQQQLRMQAVQQATENARRH